MEAVGSTLIRSQGTLEEALAQVNRMGFRLVELGVQPWCDLKPENLMNRYERELARVQRLLEQHQLTAVGLNAGLTERTPEEMQMLAALANDLSIKIITTNPRSPETDFAGEAEQLRELVRICAAAGAQATIETHMFSMTEKPENALRLAQHVPGLGLTLDVSHYYCNGSEDRISPLLPFVKHVHIRDCGRTWDRIQMPFGEGLLELKRWADELRAAGYNGFIAVEYIDLPDVAFAVEEATVNCKKAIEAIWGDE